MRLSGIDLFANDVPVAVSFFRDVIGLQVEADFDAFGAVTDGGPATIMINHSDQPTTQVMLQFVVDDVSAALATARSRGAAVLLEPTKMDFGAEVADIAGPEQIKIRFTRPLD